MTPSEAYDYIAGILPRFQSDGETLYAQLHAASVLKGLSNDYADTSDLDLIIEETNQDINSWQSIVNKLQPFLSVFGYTGLGDPVTAWVIANGVTLIAIAALLLAFYSYNKINQHSAALKVIAAQVNLSPSDQAIVDKATQSTGIFGSLFSGLGSLGNYILIGGAIYLFMLWNRH